MITREQLTPVGRLVKPHGINGEIQALLQADVDLKAARCLVVDIDGIFVPFFPASVRPRSADSVLVRFDGIADEADAKTLCGKDFYCLADDETVAGDTSGADPDGEDGFFADDLVGFRILDDASGSQIGTIADFDDSTDNALFIVDTPDGRTVYIPIADEFITDIDTDAMTISMDLPEGLV